jgi:hypothetical protein
MRDVGLAMPAKANNANAEVKRYLSVTAKRVIEIVGHGFEEKKIAKTRKVCRALWHAVSGIWIDQTQIDLERIGKNWVDLVFVKEKEFIDK